VGGPVEPHLDHPYHRNITGPPSASLLRLAGKMVPSQGHEASPAGAEGCMLNYRLTIALAIVIGYVLWEMLGHMGIVF
jgi:hypothetical protein